MDLQKAININWSKEDNVIQQTWLVSFANSKVNSLLISFSSWTKCGLHVDEAYKDDEKSIRPKCKPRGIFGSNPKNCHQLGHVEEIFTGIGAKKSSKGDWPFSIVLVSSLARVLVFSSWLWLIVAPAHLARVSSWYELIWLGYEKGRGKREVTYLSQS